jgi:hypothetical protein
LHVAAVGLLGSHVARLPETPQMSSSVAVEYAEFFE